MPDQLTSPCSLTMTSMVPRNVCCATRVLGGLHVGMLRTMATGAVTPSSAAVNTRGAAGVGATAAGDAAAGGGGGGGAAALIEASDNARKPSASCFSSPNADA